MKNNYIMIYRSRLRQAFPRWPKFGRKTAIIAAILILITSVKFFSLGVLQLPASRIPYPNGIGFGWSPAKVNESVFSYEGNLRPLFDDNFFYDAYPPAVFSTKGDSGPVTVLTTIDPAVQQRLIRLFKRYTPLLAAGVVVDARTGAVLAMGNYLGNDEAVELFPESEINYCLFAGFPAASLIKIVTAAAVLEKRGFSNSEALPVSGRYYTLYKHQLGLKKARFRAESVSLEKAFSRSINPFFGRLGIDHLTEKEFFDVAEAFLFNMPLEFDFPLYQSCIFIPATKFERAELASGFNTRTTISPLHAALIAALPICDGKMMRPFLVERVIGENGEELYNSRPKILAQSLSGPSVENLSRLMQATIRYGTARKSFSHLRRLRDYRNWVLGGKTGAINLPHKQKRCEWFAGFAKKGELELAIAVVIVHGDIRTVKPSFVAAELIRPFFKRRNISTVNAEGKIKKISSG